MEKQSCVNKLFNRKNNEVYLGKSSDKSQVEGSSASKSDVLINLSPEQIKSLNLQGIELKVDTSKFTNMSLEGVFIEHVDLERQKELEERFKKIDFPKLDPEQLKNQNLPDLPKEESKHHK